MTEHRVNRQWLLSRRPQGAVSRDDFNFVEGPVPTPGPGEVLVRTLYFGYDAAQRMWLTEYGGGYMPPIAIGEPMRTGALAQVIESNDPAYKVGDIVEGLMSWQDYLVVRSDGPMPLRVVESAAFPLTWNLGVFGVGGLTAYFAVVDGLKVGPGDTVVISAATGATGSLAGAICKQLGAKTVIGIAGGEEKCRWIVENAGYDAAIDYKNDDIDAALSRLCPDGVNAFLDGVGGEIADAMFLHMAPLGRIVITGAISSGYTGPETRGPSNYMQICPLQLTVRGFLLLYYRDQLASGIEQLGKWLQEGCLHVEETIVDGFENAPDLLPTIFSGKKPGRLLLKVADAV
jgi:NADPH-dependent curcumin reductase CurA